MKKFLKNKSIICFIVIAVVIILVVSIGDDKSKDITRDIEKSNFTIIKPIEAPNMYPVYLAVYNSCNGKASSGNGCTTECGFGDLDPCYFFNYDQITHKPHVIAKYYSHDDALYQTIMGFRDSNTIYFNTGKFFVATSSDYSHYIFYTKELDLRSGKITTVKEEETYEKYESMP